MAESNERGPCPRCGEPAPLAGRICPHCKGSLLVDVALASAPAGGRERYQAARALSLLGAGAPSFSAAQQAMAIQGSVIVSGATREVAARVLAALEEHGARGRTTRAVEDGPVAAEAPGSRVSSFLVVVIVLAVAGFALYAWSRHLGGEDEIELSASNDLVPDQGPELSTRELAERAAPATISLRCASFLGSGFLVAKDLVLTDAHVLCPPGEALRAMLANGREIPATVAQRDDWLDLAVVQVPGADALPLPLGDATNLRTGDRVMLVGTSEGLKPSAGEGIVRHRARNIFGLAFLQIDAGAGAGGVVPGNGGGPLLDKHGRVVGVVAARAASSGGLGLALPINYAYSGARSLLPPPRLPLVNEPGWEHLLSEVAKADHREAQREQKETGRPALVAVTTPPGKGLVAVLARHVSSEPRAETMSFSFHGNNRELCRVSSVAEGWRKAADSAGEAGEASASRYLQWMKKNGLESDLYLGFATLDVQGCPIEEMRGADLVLEGADERADRVGI